MSDLAFIIRPYQPRDRAAVRTIYGTDEFARPQLMQKYHRMKLYLADSMSHYYDHEPRERSCPIPHHDEHVGVRYGEAG